VTDAAHHDSRRRGNVPRACRHRHGTRPREIHRRLHESRHLRPGEHRHHRGSNLRSAKQVRLVEREDSEARQLPPYEFLRMRKAATLSKRTVDVDQRNPLF
jgi:hypothetical protein